MTIKYKRVYTDYGSGDEFIGYDVYVDGKKVKRINKDKSWGNKTVYHIENDGYVYYTLAAAKKEIQQLFGGMVCQ